VRKPDASTGYASYLAVNGARAEDFVFAWRFKGGAGDGGHGDSVSHRVEDFDGVPFRPIRRNVAIDKLNDIPSFKPMLWHIALQDGVGIEF
jgi:hypothetical protein